MVSGEKGVPLIPKGGGNSGNTYQISLFPLFHFFQHMGIDHRLMHGWRGPTRINDLVVVLTSFDNSSTKEGSKFLGG